MRNKCFHFLFFFIHITSILTFLEQVFFPPFYYLFLTRRCEKRNNWRMPPYSQKKKMQPLESLSFLASLPNTEIGQKSPSCNNVYIMCMHQGKSRAVCWQKRGLWLQQRHCPPCTWSWRLWNLAWKKGNFWEASLISHPFVSPLPKSPPDMSCSHSVFFRLPLKIFLCLQQEPRPKSLSCASILLCVSPISTGAPNGSPLPLYLSDAVIKGPLFMFYYF